MKKNIMIYLLIINLLIVSRIIFIMNSNYKAYKDDNSISGLTAPRGRILDIKGNILVDNIGVKSLIFNKLQISVKEEIEIAKSLSNQIDLPSKIDDYNLRYYYYLINEKKINNKVSSNVLKAYEERKIGSTDLLKAKLELITDEELKQINAKEAYIFYLMNNGYNYQDKIIKTELTDEEYLKINNSNLKGIRTELTWNRYYPYGNLLRDVLGNVSSYEQGIPYELKNIYLKEGYNLNDRVGINNLEFIYDHYLKGEKALYKIENNYLTLEKEYVKGHDLVLNIDIELQQNIEKVLEEEMKKAVVAPNSRYYNSSYIVVTNPNNGNVIALVGKKINKDQTFSDYSYYNVINSFTVGSVVKGASISVGYKYNLIDNSHKILDGCIKLKNQKEKCSWKSLGYLDDIEALRMSSNYYQYLLAVKLTGNKYKPNLKINATSKHFDIYRNMFNEYGLGVKTGIDLSNESTGIKGTSISDDLLLNYAIGQYDTFTPIELSSYINTIAVSKRYELKILNSVLNNDGSIYYKKEDNVLSKAPISEEYLNRIRLGFKAVNATGTGYGYVPQNYSSAGKTGTSESFIDTDNDDIVDKKTITTSYVMYAPFDNPKASIVMVSPNIKYQNGTNNYKYPINARVMNKVSKLVLENN